VAGCGRLMKKGFGGSGDYSSFFSGLYSQNNAAQKAKQDAEDQDALDRWENGLMTDGEWLAYVANRITAESDPKRKQKWITAQRKYTTVIADKQAEFAYEEGGSINELIGHYEARMASMQPESNEYRELQLRVNDLMDQRSAEKIQEESEKLLLEIEKGTKTYGDLRDYLRDAHAQSRPNSDLRKQIDNQLDQVNETIRTNKVEGQFEKLQYQYDAGSLSARGYARALRRMAEPFKANDPKRYYQILQAAVALEKQGGSGGGGGGGGYSGGGGSGGGGSKKAINASIDALQAQRNDLLAAIEVYEAGGKDFVDSTGKKVALTSAYIKQVDSKLMTVWDKMSAAYTAKGDKSAAKNAKKTKAEYIAKAVTLHNTIDADEASRHLLEATTKQIQGALENPDPVAARAALQAVAAQWSAFSKGLTNRVSPYGDGTGGEVSPMERTDPDFAARSATFAAALTTLTTDGIDDASAAAALESIGVLQGAGGGRTDGGQQDGYLNSILTGVLEVSARVQGMQDGSLDRVAVGSGWAWVKKAPVSFMAPDPNNPANMMMVTQMQATGETTDGRTLDIDGKSTRLVDVIVDINGKPTKVKAVAELVEPAGFNVLKTTKQITLSNGTKIAADTVLTESQIAMIEKDRGIESLLTTKVLESAAGFSAWQVTVPGRTDQYGREHAGETWTMDSDTGLWYRGSLPIRGIQRNAYGAVMVGDDGKLKLDWQAYASAQGAPAPYVGSSAKGAQALLDMGLLDVSGIRGRDLLGNLSGEAVDMSTAYYDPADDLAPYRKEGSPEDSWWNPDARKAKSERLVNLVREQTRRYSQDQMAQFHGTGRPLKHQADDPMAAFNSIGKAVGVNLEGTRDKPKLSLQSQDAKAQISLPIPSGSGKGPTVKLAGGQATGPSVKGDVSLNLNLATAEDDDKFVPKVKPMVKTTGAKKKAAAVKAKPKVKPKVAPKKTDTALAKETQLKTGQKYVTL
jgi:hypothetical protein